MEWLTDLTQIVSSDPVVQQVLGVLVAVVALAIVIAIVTAGLRPLISKLRARYPGHPDAWRVGIRISRWGVALLLCLIPGQPIASLPWLAVIALALAGAEGSESVWGWVKSLARLAGRRVTSAVSGD